MWEFSIGLILLELCPDSLALVALFGLLDSIAQVIAGPHIGAYVDRHAFLPCLSSITLSSCAISACQQSFFQVCLQVQGPTYPSSISNDSAQPRSVHSWHGVDLLAQHGSQSSMRRAVHSMSWCDPMQNAKTGGSSQHVQAAECCCGSLSIQRLPDIVPDDGKPCLLDHCPGHHTHRGCEQRGLSGQLSICGEGMDKSAVPGRFYISCCRQCRCADKDSHTSCA